MIIASKARELTEKAIEEEINTRRARAEEYCENIGKQIEAESGKRKSELTVEDIPNNIYSYVIGILKDNGYAVTQLNNHSLVVIW